jgi:outer membrane protein OmpA-like peptidoglycan-associated protein
MKTNLVLSLALSAFTFLPLTAQQGAAPSTPDNQNPPPSSQQPADNNSAPDAQKPDTQPNPDDQPNGKVYTYRVTVVERTTQAIDYRDRGGTTQVDFKGTSLTPAVDGNAKVTGHTGRLAIDVTLRHLAPPRSFGPEYLTYVLWAITPEGRPSNMGEIRPNDDGNSRLQVTSGLQEFGMIVTAEPYFAVTRPSDVVVAENIVRQDTAGGIHPISAKFDLLQKGQYTVNLSPDQLPATTADKKTPLELLEAQNAIAIAQAAGADQYAADTLGKAKAYLAQGQNYLRQKQNITPIGAVARATQAAEDARLLTLQKKQEEQTAAERQRAQDRIHQAQSQAESESARADAARLDAQHQKEQRELAEQERQAAQQAKLEAEQAAQQASQDRAAAQQQLQQSEEARQAAAQQAEQARLQAQQSDQARAQAVQQAEEQRQRLLKQLNQVLQTRDSARGLIVSMSDVLFDFNQATLKPGAKLRLAKVSGIILAYPDLKLEIDGFTDNKGTPQYNMTLSDKRAKAVRDFLVAQGVGSDAVNTKGFGDSNPVASNATAAGRQQNRRVELVVSGNAIGGTGAAGSATGAAPGSTGGVSGATQSGPNSTQPDMATPGSISTPAGTTGTQSRPSNGSSQPPVSNPPATDNKPPNLFQR